MPHVHCATSRPLCGSRFPQQAIPQLATPRVSAGDIDGRVSAAAQEKIILKMIEIVRRDLVTEIQSRTMRLPFHADSTTGITSTVDTAPVDGNLSPQDTYLDDQGILASYLHSQ